MTHIMGNTVTEGHVKLFQYWDKCAGVIKTQGVIVDTRGGGGLYRTRWVDRGYIGHGGGI